MKDTSKERFERLLNLYFNDIITEEQVKEQLEQKEKSERRESIERYLNLYLEGHISKEAFVDALCE